MRRPTRDRERRGRAVAGPECKFGFVYGSTCVEDGLRVHSGTTLQLYTLVTTACTTVSVGGRDRLADEMRTFDGNARSRNSAGNTTYEVTPRRHRSTAAPAATAATAAITSQIEHGHGHGHGTANTLAAGLASAASWPGDGLEARWYLEGEQALGVSYFIPIWHDNLQ